MATSEERKMREADEEINQKVKVSLGVRCRIERQPMRSSPMSTSSLFDMTKTSRCSMADAYIVAH